MPAMGTDGYYPDDMQDEWYCEVEGHLGDTHCSRCGFVNYAWLGYLGAVARWAKAWGITKIEAEKRITNRREVEEWLNQLTASKQR